MADANPKLDSGNYDSSFEDDSKQSTSKAKDVIYLKNEQQSQKRAFKPDYDAHWSDRSKTLPLLALDAYSRHKELINHYRLYHPACVDGFRRNRTNDKTDLDVLRENHKFVWSDVLSESELSWEQRLAKKYYDKLFKEYCVADLTRYKENKIGMRWRIEKEVVDGKGQFFCGSKHCNVNVGLRSWEVNFAYSENGERKNALVKLRLCPDCSYQLNYRHKKKEIIPKKLTSHKEKQSKRAKVEEEEETKTSQSSEENPTDADTEEPDDANIWSKKPQIPVPEDSEEKREEEFDEYFQDLFL